MLKHAQLDIRFTAGISQLRFERSYLNEYCGGPGVLLQWLETQLGLPSPKIPLASRISEYAGALDASKEPLFVGSLKADRWATACELLARQDELLLSGWDKADSEAYPELVRALARVGNGRKFQFPGEAERLNRVLSALAEGQSLPPHECVLRDAKELWPAVWQGVLSKLNTIDPAEVILKSPEGSALRGAQAILLRGEGIKIKPDETFRFVRARSDSAVVEFVAGILAQFPEKLPTTVICCGDDDMALRLDACLNRMGLPTTGASAWSRTYPVLQILPLSLALCWQPVDPQALLDFLTLPILPIPRKVALRLAEALASEPGLGSGEWETAVSELCDEEHDPQGQLRERLDIWFRGERAAKGEEMPSRLIQARCGMVAQWAAGRATALINDGTASPELIEALQTAAGQASLLGELAEGQGAALSEPQLERLLEEALASGVQTRPFIEAAGGPTRVRSLAEIVQPLDWLIWVGASTDTAVGCRWSSSQLRQLRKAGVEVDDGSKTLFALRAAEARGFCQVKESFLLVLLPRDLEKRWHPHWLTLRNSFLKEESDHPPVLEDLVAAGNTNALSPFGFIHQDLDIEPAQKPRPLWNISAKYLADRKSVSASELQDRLGCPLKWTLQYLARLRSSPIAQLPDDHRLKGTFCHSVFEHVFGSGGALPTVDDAVARVLTTFDERLPLDAAPLAQPNKYFERQRLRGELEHATRVFVGALASGGYRIVGIEVELSGTAFGKPLNGRIDCLAERQSADEVIVDFKYGGRSKYYSLIKDGRAVQLATYAHGRSTAKGRFPAVAYLILSDGLLYTPSESPILSGPLGSPIKAPAIQTVWQNFSSAIEQAEDWLKTKANVPARPLQDPAAWPAGVQMVLEDNLKPDTQQEVCRYCDYQRLCGIQETI